MQLKLGKEFVTIISDLNQFMNTIRFQISSSENKTK